MPVQLEDSPEPPLLPAQPPAPVAAATSCSFSGLAPAFAAPKWCWRWLRCLSAAEWHLMVPGGAASQRDRGLCIAGRRLPGVAMLLVPVFQSVFVSPSDCTEFKLLLTSPTGLFSSARAALAPCQAPLLLAVLGSPYLPAQTLQNGADVPQPAIM